MKRYRKHKIPKASGGFRVLQIPDPSIRNVQSKLLKTIFSKFESPEYVYAFESRKSIPDMAKLHVGKDFVVSLDIHNFFGNVTQKKIQEILLTRIPNIHHTVARTISELVTYKAYLPQGGITSPKVSNIVVAHTFGPELYDFCSSNNLKLTIYADDVTISFNGTRGQANTVVRDVTRVLLSHGFRVNSKKTKIMESTSRQWVCGAVVNAKTNLMRSKRDELKARVHNIEKNGLEAEATRAGHETTEEYLASLRGKINWFRQLNPEKGGELMEKLATLTAVNEEVATP